MSRAVPPTQGRRSRGRPGAAWAWLVKTTEERCATDGEDAARKYMRITEVRITVARGCGVGPRGQGSRGAGPVRKLRHSD